MRKICSTIFLIIYCHTTILGQEYRDVVFMKNGSVIKGFYKEFYPTDSLRLETIDGGVFICSMNDVVRIAKEKTSIYVVNTQVQLPPRIWRPKGYKGGLEYGIDVSSNDSDIKLTSLITTHGYQFNPFFYAGVGLGLQQLEVKRDKLDVTFSEDIIPIFAETQVNILKTRFSPFFDIRAGYLIKGFKGFYFNPSIGINFGISPRSGGYLLIGYACEHTKGNNDERTKIETISYRMGLYF